MQQTTSNPAKEGVSPWMGGVCLAGAALGLAGYLVAWHGVAILVVLRVMLALIVLGLLPGLILLRLVFRLPTTRPFEDSIAALLLGMLITPAVWFALASVGLEKVFVLGVVGLTVIAPFALGWHRQSAAKVRRAARDIDPVALVVVVGATVLWSYSLRIVEPADGGMIVVPYTDHIQHALMVHELSLSTPTQAVPFLVTAKKWAYHMLPDVWCDLLARTSGANSNQAYFFLALPLRYVLVTLAVYLFLARRFGRRAAWIGALCVFGFAGWGERQLLANWLLVYLHQSYPTAFGLVGVFLILAILTDLRPEGQGPRLLLCSVLSVLLLWYKANFALVTAPAVFVLCSLVLLRQRRFGWWGACVGVQAAFVLLRWIDVSSADMHATLAFAPGAFVEHWWGAIGTWWGSAVVSTVMNGTVIPAIVSLPSALEWSAKFVVLVVWRFHVALIVLPYAVWRLGFARRQEPNRHADRLVLGILACAVIGFVVFPIQRGMTWNVSLHNMFLMDAMLLALLGVVAWDVARRLARRGRIAAVGVTAVVLFIAADSGRRVTGGVIPSLPDRCFVTNDMVACCDFVANETPEDAVILHPDYNRRDHGVAVLMQRRQVLDNAPCWQQQHMRYVSDVIDDLDALFGRRNPQASPDVLARYRVDYVVADDCELEPSRLWPMLDEVFRAGRVAVYRVDKEVRLAKAR